MMQPLFVAVGEHSDLAARLAHTVGGELAPIEMRRFPDGETYLRYRTDPAGRPVIVVCSLDRPDGKFLPIMFAAAAGRDLRATSIGLVAPYLAYMRQDRRFRPGEAITSRYFAGILAREFDWLVTVDPHLHRRGSLSEIYPVPADALQAAPLIADWIRQAVEQPLLIGPDAESEQWVSAVARGVGAPYIVLDKVRRGDRNVEISIPEVERWRSYTPVLVDDIVSTARTMIETVRHLVRSGMRSPVCVAVHGVFAGSAYEELLKAGAMQIATCNTIRHESNTIDVTDLLAHAVKRMLSSPATTAGTRRPR